jgi:hypothetical protein
VFVCACPRTYAIFILKILRVDEKSERISVPEKTIILTKVYINVKWNERNPFLLLLLRWHEQIKNDGDS